MLWLRKLLAQVINSGGNSKVLKDLIHRISFKGKQRRYKGLITFLDLGGCENGVDSQFARNELQLPIHMDDSKAAQQIQQAVNGNTFSFTEFVEVNCNFDRHKEKVKFFLGY